jgi:hypothetical protein
MSTMYCMTCKRVIPPLTPFIEDQLRADSRVCSFCSEDCHFKWRKDHKLGTPQEFGRCGYKGWCWGSGGGKYYDGLCRHHSQDVAAVQARERAAAKREQRRTPPAEERPEAVSEYKQLSMASNASAETVLRPKLKQGWEIVFCTTDMCLLRRDS